jgi:hypothetical protein
MKREARKWLRLYGKITILVLRASAPVARERHQSHQQCRFTPQPTIATSGTIIAC